MTDSVIQKLTETFRKFPGIGPRQARRFVYYLLRSNHGTLENLISQIRELKKNTAQCHSCFRYFPLSQNDKPSKLCPTCADSNRNHGLLMIVEKDVDLENIEQSGTYSGHYFVLGGNIPILEKQPERIVRLTELLVAIKERSANGLTEVILALAATPEGDHSADYLKQFLVSHFPPPTLNLKISTLGRGLSTGTELEYSDADTLKNALKHRE